MMLLVLDLADLDLVLKNYVDLFYGGVPGLDLRDVNWDPLRS
jgi:hypothetical protein